MHIPYKNSFRSAAIQLPREIMGISLIADARNELNRVIG